MTHSGTYTELSAQGVDFQTLLQNKFKEHELQQVVKLEDTTGEKTNNTIEKLTYLLANQREEKAQHISAEERQFGAVDLKIFHRYFISGGLHIFIGIFSVGISIFSLFFILATIALHALAEGLSLFSSYWLALWSSGYFFNAITHYKPFCFVLPLLVGHSI